MFSAARNQNLIGLIVQLVVSLELANDRRFELRRAVHFGIFGLAGVNGINCRLFDVVGSIEVWLTGPQTNNVLTGCF